jgi:predicted flap endonuclease-1-like 5' DNA nuclease
VIQAVLSLAALALAWILLVLRVDPVPTWFYVFAWYPTLTLLDSVATRLDRKPSLLFGRPAEALSLFAWSPVVWLVFEAANFRLRNWYYVFLPAQAVERWAGILLSFATVLPAIVLAERVLAASGVFTGRRSRARLARPWMLTASVILALVATAFVALFPTFCFPLVWGIGLFLLEPFVYRRAPQLSLFRDIEAGDWGRIGRLLLGGLGIGLLWESYNHLAQGRWIYTVPGLEHLKLFEMPPLGFLGFPVFALEAWAMYSALCAVGVAVPVVGARRVVRGRVVVSSVLAAAFAVGTLLGMERFTISSTAPRLADLPGLTPSAVHALRDAGVRTPRQLAATSPARIAAVTSLDTDQARALVARTQLTLLRGIGVAHATALADLGVTRVCDLVGRDADALSTQIRTAHPGARPTAAEVRVWVRAAERVCE